MGEVAEQRQQTDNSNNKRRRVVGRRKKKKKKKDDGDDDDSTQQSKNRKITPSKIKDPNDAASYLTNWKQQQQQQQQQGDGASAAAAWKFNKNTQSWLIRHMYEIDKVSKSTFSVLVEYLGGLHNAQAKQRIVDDATRRALRYKDYEKRDNNKDDDDDDDDDYEKDDDGKATSKASSDVNDNNDEMKRWKKLNDNEKRKEYKRARKILDVLGGGK